MFLNNIYRFFISFPPSHNEFEVFPLNDKLNFTNEKKGFRHQRKVTTKLVFQNPVFDLMLAQKRANNCELIKLRIETTFNNGTSWVICYAANIRLVDCQFNVSKCIVTCDLSNNDIYACFDKNMADEKNIWLTPISNISTLPQNGGITYNISTCSEGNTIINPSTNCIDPLEPWTEIQTTSEVSDTGPPVTYQITTIWGRAEINNGTIPPGAGWVNLGGTLYARPLTVSETATIYGTQGVGASMGNAYKLNWLLEWFGGAECWNRPNGNNTCAEGGSNSCKFNVISNFFSINPDGANQANQTYSFAIPNLNHLFLFQKSDILRSAIATDWAKPKLSFKALMDELETIFDIEWWLEPNPIGIISLLNPHLTGEPILRIEHKSYRADRKMLNLTQPQFQKDILGKQEFSDKKEKLPQTEVFSFFQTTDKTGDFDSGLIEYSKNCSDADTKEQKFQTAKIMTNFAWLLNNIPSITQNTGAEEFEGFCLVATSLNGLDYAVSSEVGLISQQEQINAHLSWSNLLDKYHRYDRPQKHGILNGTNTLFSSVRPKRQQVPLTVTMCRADYFNIFDSRDQVKTQFGWGVVDAASYEEPTQQLTIQVSH